MQNMNKHSRYGALVLVIALWWAAPLPVQAAPFTPAVEYDTEASFGSVIGVTTVGYQFSTSVPFNVDALASWDISHLGAENVNNNLVGLWDSGGTLLVSTTVLASDPVQGHFQYHSIPTFSLAPGTYTIGLETPNGFTGYINVVGLVTVPGFTWNTAAIGSNSGLNFPDDLHYGNGLGTNGVLLVNFSIASSTSPVPEPATLLLLGAGLVGLAAWQRKHAA